MLNQKHADINLKALLIVTLFERAKSHEIEGRTLDEKRKTGVASRIIQLQKVVIARARKQAEIVFLPRPP